MQIAQTLFRKRAASFASAAPQLAAIGLEPPLERVVINLAPAGIRSKR